MGANIDRINAVKAAVLPTFTYNPLVIATSSLTPCVQDTYCEQQLTISSGASGPKGFVMWHLTSGTLPTGMNFSTFDKNLGTDAKVTAISRMAPPDRRAGFGAHPHRRGASR